MHMEVTLIRNKATECGGLKHRLWKPTVWDKFSFCHILAVRTCTGYLTSLCFQFLSSKMRIIILCTSYGSWEEYIKQLKQCPASSTHSINVSYYYLIGVHFICIFGLIWVWALVIFQGIKTLHIDY